MTGPSGMPEMLVIGVGNDERGDDGIGLWVARHLQARNLRSLRTVEFRSHPTGLLELWTYTHWVYLVDAMASGAAPGSVVRMDATHDALKKGGFCLSTHGSGVVDAVELARSLNRLPSRLVVYGIEGSSFGVGFGISLEGMHGAECAAKAILREFYGAKHEGSHA